MNELASKYSPEEVVGLNNLSNRCKLLLGEGIIVTKANNLFTVKVPLAYE